MEEDPTSTLTKKRVSATNQSSNKSTRATFLTVTARQPKFMAGVGHLLAATLTVACSLFTAGNSGVVELMENHAHSLFYQLRGAVKPPDDIVILAIDDGSISVPEQYYKTDPQQYAYLEPLKAFPFQRKAYAQVIEKLVQSGARAVAFDVVFDIPSSYGEADDKELQRVLQRYGHKVSLAAIYQEPNMRQGPIWQLSQPQEIFRTDGVSIGSANFPTEVDGKIHRLGSEFLSTLSDTENTLWDNIPDLDVATLQAAQVDYPKPLGDRIHFWGGADTFETIPFLDVFDPNNWNSYLQQGRFFKNKIVLIGATAQITQDYWSVPASGNWLSPQKMSGVEVHANAIATLMTGKSIRQAIPDLRLRGVAVFALISTGVLIITRNKRGVNRFFLGLGIAGVWGGVGYYSFIGSQLIFPTAVPVFGICAIGFCYLATEFAKEKIRKLQLVDILEKHATNRVVQEIISQQEDLKDLLRERLMEVSGKILDGRYRIVEVLGSGGFSETYIAEDTKLPGEPKCVVKQLKPTNTKSDSLEVARRLFKSEAQILQKLGNHNQIPQLLAYFEEDEEFYLVQEYILGHPLSEELTTGRTYKEGIVINILRDILQTLSFVHNNGVIHRDIKPSNIMRRDADGKLVLIDFGAVKEVTTQLLEDQDIEQSAYTIRIGTKGYTPSEQSFGRPQFASDIYAVGMIGIKALTGISPHDLERDALDEVKWLHKANVSSDLAKIINQMVREDVQERFRSASEVLRALEELVTASDTNEIEFNPPADDPDIATAAWEFPDEK